MHFLANIERMRAERRIIEAADQISRNVGRVDFLEGNAYGAGMEKWRQMLNNMVATPDDPLVVNLWKVSETAYRDDHGVEQGLSAGDQ